MDNNVSSVGPSPTQNGLIRIKSQHDDVKKVSARLSYGGELEITLPSDGVAADVLKSALFQVGVTCFDIKQIEKIASRNGNNALDTEDEFNDLDKYLEGCLPFDRNYILAAVKENGRALQFADSSLKKDKEIVLAAVKKFGGSLEFADGSLKKDKIIVLAAVKANGWALKFADISFKKDKNIVLAAVKVYGRALEFADISLKKDKNIVLAAIKANGQALEFADISFKKDKNIVLVAIKENGRALEFADISLKKDKEFVLDAVKMDGWVLEFADASLKRDKEIVLAAVRENGRALVSADESIKTDPAFLETAFNTNFNIYSLMPEGIKNIFTERYEKILKNLNEINIEFLQRFRSIESVQEIIKNRRYLNEIEPRPLAICIYAKKDRNTAFEKNQIEDLIANGYRVDYFEAGTDKEVYNALIDATSGKPAELLILAGHGTQTQITFGSDEFARSEIENRDKYIDLSDENEMRKRVLSKCIAKNAVIILDSCSTGEGKQKAKNVAGLIRAIFPESTIFAPTKPAIIEKYEFDKKGKVIDVIYSVGKENTYSIKQ
jgi:hypothetical protein